MPEPSAMTSNVTAMAANVPAIAALQENGVRPGSGAGTSIKAVSVMAAFLRAHSRVASCALRISSLNDQQTAGGCVPQNDGELPPC